MQPLTPRRLVLAHSVLGWTLSVVALAIGIAMWRHFSSIVPPPPAAVMISSMVWILCGMLGIFYNARRSGLLSNQQPQVPAVNDSPLSLALQRLRQLQEQLDQKVITLDQYRQGRREIIEAVQDVSGSSDCE